MNYGIYMANDINKTAFDEATKLKLEIFKDCFKEWLPVFIHNPKIKKTYIYDFFAGSGKDLLGNKGSPLILLDEAKGLDQMHCSKARPNSVIFAFNEKIDVKSKELKVNVEEHVNLCLLNCGRGKCIYEHHYGNFTFHDVFKNVNVVNILDNPLYGKFILLDQYGFREVDDQIFTRLVDSPKTDFIFFISSSFIKRFSQHEYVRKYFQTENINFDETKPKECHKEVARYFRKLIPLNKEYYIHHFTIKKGTNYYGLIFGTGHSYGMEKFLKVCWNKDALAGEANFNMYDDFQRGTLFYNESNTNKIEEVKLSLENHILTQKINNNLDGLKFVLRKGVDPSVFVEKIIEMKDVRKLININGIFNKKKSNIHKLKDIDIYKIELK